MYNTNYIRHMYNTWWGAGVLYSSIYECINEASIKRFFLLLEMFTIICINWVEVCGGVENKGKFFFPYFSFLLFSVNNNNNNIRTTSHHRIHIVTKKRPLKNIYKCMWCMYIYRYIRSTTILFIYINNVLKMKSLMNVECMNGFSVISRFDGDERIYNSERNGKELHGWYTP